MTYEEILDWMFAQLPMYQRKGQSAFKKDLTNSILLAEYLENPQHSFKAIHVGGTNGKGSTSHMLASVLQEAGYKVGLYTSPHLKDFRERIKVNGKVVSKDFVINFIKEHQSFFEKNQLSFFEMTVGMAFQYFKEQQVDVAIIEVGLGGRLDSTNIIQPIVSVITNISLDHVQMLGNSINSIAFEKAGIIKKNTPIIIGEKTDETETVFIQKAEKENAPIIFAEDLIPKHNFTSDLKGIYQQKNIRTALVTLDELSKTFQITSENVKNGLQNVIKNTSLLGRWQTLGENPKIICDTGHNVAGIQEIVKQLNSIKKRKLHLVLGFVNDKEIDEILKEFPNDAYYYFGEPNIPRKMLLEDLKKQVDKPNTRYFSKISDAFLEAKNNATKEDVIFVGGSTFVVAEIL
ncbi:dihydrofolate synthase [Flavobacteriaceae bacterium UJ101]|nr:dihydrofolate synthase [Flavobacteriaceae bacterium UJ101]